MREQALNKEKANNKTNKTSKNKNKTKKDKADNGKMCIWSNYGI
jgi:hypothetical protein